MLLIVRVKNFKSLFGEDIKKNMILERYDIGKLIIGVFIYNNIKWDGFLILRSKYELFIIMYVKDV